MYPLAKDFRALARERLSGYWGVSIAVCLVASVILSAASFTYVGTLLLAGPLELGICVFFSCLVLGEKREFTTLFCRFEQFFKACGLYLFMCLFIFLWSLLFFVPGIIAAYRYAMAPFLMAEYPDMGIQEAVNKSKELMDGNKGRLFCLHLSFIGWCLLGALSFGILFIWLMPYMSAADAAFYMNLTGRIMQPAGSGSGGAPEAEKPFAEHLRDTETL